MNWFNWHSQLKEGRKDCSKNQLHRFRLWQDKKKEREYYSPKPRERERERERDVAQKSYLDFSKLETSIFNLS
jgi:hypothetical protein